MNITITLTAEETLAAMENGSLASFITNNREVAVPATLEETTGSAGQGVQMPGSNLPPAVTAPVNTQQPQQPQEPTWIPGGGGVESQPMQPQQPVQQAPMGMPQQAPPFQQGQGNQPIMSGPTNAPVPNGQGYQQPNVQQPGQPVMGNPGQPVMGNPGQPVMGNPGQPAAVLNQPAQGGQPVTLDELRMKLWEISKQPGKDVNGLLTNFGAVKIEDLDPSRYSDFLAAANNL